MVAAATLLVMGGCTGVDDGSWAEGGMASDSAGIRVVTLPGDDVQVLRWAFTPDADWRPAEEPEFGHLAHVAVVPPVVPGATDDVRVAALDAQAARIWVFDGADGALTATFGGPGGGPGEFDVAGLSVLVATDSSLWVPDLVAQRLTELAPDGRLLRTVPFPAVGPGEGAAYLVEWRAHPSGGLAFRWLAPDGDRVMRMEMPVRDAGGLGAGPGGGVDPRSGAGTPTRPRAELLYRFAAPEVPHNTLLPPTPLWALTPDGGLAVAWSHRPQVEWRERPGTERPRWVARRPDTGGPLTEAEGIHLEEIVVSTQEELLGGATLDAEARAELLAQVNLPEERPVLAALMAAPDGDLWVRRAAPVQEMGREAIRVGVAVGFGGREWDVLDPDGFLRARAVLPQEFEPTSMAGDFIYGVFTGPLGVQRPGRVRRVDDGGPREQVAPGG